AGSTPTSTSTPGTTVPGSPPTHPILYVTDSDHNRLVKIDPSGTASTIPITGPTYPMGVAADTGGNVYVGSFYTPNNNVDTVTWIDPHGTQTNLASIGNGGGIAVATDGSLYVADSSDGGVVHVTLPPNPTATFVDNGPHVLGIAVDQSGHVFYTAGDVGLLTGEVLFISLSWVSVLNMPGVTGALPDLSGLSGLNRPTGLVVANGSLYVTDAANNNVVSYDLATHVQSLVPTSGLSDPTGVAVDASGNVYIVDRGNNRIVMVTPGGQQSTIPVNLTPGLSNPWGIALG
ncbi:MAG: hypothetical protein JST73_10870, partial [Actinobacteria bacterium]|nr:hypothetical protein [Actinomycetota bacterium]